jgi:acetyl-CoA C-acetyltransferase
MDAQRTPVVAAVGQAIERDEIVSAVELASRASQGALGAAANLRDRIQRVSLIDVVFSPVSGRPASELVACLGLKEVVSEVSTSGGNMPQYMVTRAARDIAEGRLDATLIAGAEATRSMRAADPDSDFMRHARSRDAEGERDARTGPSLDGLMSPAELAIQLVRPTEVYPLFESALAHKQGRSFEQQRRYLGPLMASFSQVAAEHPYAWFRQALSAEEVSSVGPDNRLISEPYPKRMNAFPNVDQAAAVVVTSLATARALGLEQGCLFVWSGANNAEPPATARPDLWDAPAMRAASSAALAAAGANADDLALIDLYSCFPIAVQVGAAALGVALDDPRQLTVTGGLPFFGGPGNDYSMHAIATLASKLHETDGLGYVGANGGMLSKHSIGVYGTTPPPRGFVAADTSEQQARIDAAALPLALPGDGAEGRAEVVASTVVYDRDGAIVDAPVIATLEDGRRVAARADESWVGTLEAKSLVGTRVHVSGDPLRYRLVA